MNEVSSLKYIIRETVIYLEEVSAVDAKIYYK